MSKALFTITVFVAIMFSGIGRQSFAETFYRCTRGRQTWFTNHKIPDAKCRTFLKFAGAQHKVGKKTTARVLPVAPKSSIHAMDLEKLETLIDEASAQFAIPKALIRAVITVESGFKPYVVSNVGAQGLMQLMPATAKGLGVTKPFDPRQNVLGGTKLLRRLADMFKGDLKKTLAAYYCGPSAVIRRNGIPDPDTRGYVNKIIAYYLKYSGASKASLKKNKPKSGEKNGKD